MAPRLPVYRLAGGLAVLRARVIAAIALGARFAFCAVVAATIFLT